MCYAPRLLHGFEANAGWIKNVIHAGVIDHINGRPAFNGRLVDAPPGHNVWSWPLRWERAENPKLGPGQPSLLLTLSMADLFVPGRSEPVIDRVCGTLGASNHIGLVLSRHSDRAAQYFGALDARTVRRWQPRIWPGFSAERQREFDQRWLAMRPLAEAGWFVFVSIAPMIGPVTLPPDFLEFGGERVWVIVAGEIGPRSRVRMMDSDWARSVRDQCRAANIRFFLKQMSTKKPVVPPDLWLRQFPLRYPR